MAETYETFLEIKNEKTVLGDCVPIIEMTKVMWLTNNEELPFEFRTMLKAEISQMEIFRIV